MTVTAEQIKQATAAGLQNVPIAAEVCDETGTPFYLMCALLQKESGGRNIYGHDVGGALSGFELPVTKDNYAVFRWLVFDQGQTSNGVGPLQLTYKGFFTDMEAKGLKPWDVHDNLTYGARLFMGYYREARRTLGTRESIRRAGLRYNGATSYGDRLLELAVKWADVVGHGDH